MIRASVVGATGYTGMVLTDILSRHPEVRLDALTSQSYVGLGVQEVFPHLRVTGVYEQYSPARLAESDVAFVCYPHAEAHLAVADLVGNGQRVVDLSADFRLREPAQYPQWYGFEHPYADLVEEAVYGLPELNRELIAAARIVANPGCYPTSALLAVAPLAKGLAEAPIIIDSKSGVSGAGRGATAKTHFCSVQDNFKAYSEIGHRHTAEILQEIALLAGRPLPVSFTPHLLPVDRGILTVCYLTPAAGMESAAALQELYREFYAGEPFVEVVAQAPSLKEVQYTNYCRLCLRPDPAAGLIKVISVIDNLVKGASGQAVQNMNIMFGLEETLGLEAKS